MVIRRGDVFWSSVSGGRRPVVVITRDTAISLLNSVTVVPTTRVVRGIPAEVRLTKADGMPSECVANLDKVQTVPRSSLKGRITTLSPARLEALCDALHYAVGC